MRGWTICLTISLSVLVTRAAHADGLDPENLRLSWSEPDAAHTMTITWTTELDGASTMVEYGVDSSDVRFFEGESFAANADLGFVHVAELTGLDPNTVYRYRVGGPGRWTEENLFHTAPEPCTDSFRFVALGDNRPDIAALPQPNWNPILAEATGLGPDFIIHTGDIVKDGDSSSQWNTFFESSAPYLAEFPFLAALGNHDDGPDDGDLANYNQLFSFPRNSVTETEDFYFFTYSDAIFVSISTQTYTGGSIPFETQAQWLDQVLTDNPRTWKIVFLHHPPYASHTVFDLGFTEFEFNHPPNENDQNAALVPVFDRHHVDIVFAGHNHYYERFQPLYGGGGADEGNVADGFSDGTVYTITGGAGAFTYDEFEIFDIDVDLINGVCGEATGSNVCSGRHHYVLVEIDGPTLTYEAWTTAQQLDGWDEGNIHRIERFEIVKDDVLCTPPEDDQGDEPSVPPDQPPEPVEDASIEVQEEIAVEEDAISDDERVEDGSGAVPLEDITTPEQPPPASSGDTSAQNDGCSCQTWAGSGPGPMIGLLVLLLVGVARRPSRRTAQ